MKRILGMTLGIMLVLLLSVSVALADEEKQNGAYTYQIKGNGTAVITGYDWENHEGEDIYIPRMVDGYTVTEIGEFAFSHYSFDDNGNPELGNFFSDAMAGSLVIPDTITTIGKGAFFGITLASKAINIPNSVGFIGKGAFSYIFGVEQFAVGAQNPVYATIDGVLFNKKEKALIAFPCDKQGTGDKENYTFPDGITTIADYACYGFNYRASSISFSHTDIRYVVFPETLTSIGNYSFAEAEKITTVSDGRRLTLPKSVSQLGIGAFRGANSRDGGRGTVIDLGLTNLHEIPDYAFYGWNIDDIVFPKQVETIGAYAFSEFSGYPDFIIPSSVKEIKTGAFSSNAEYLLASFKFEEGSQLQTIGDCAFEGTSFSSSDNEIVLPNGLKDIGNSAFKNCKNLEKITIPASVSSIGKDVCTRESVYLNVESGSYAASWASENGYMTTGTGSEDTSWLND